MTMDGSLRCYNADTVTLLLKSSDQVGEVLSNVPRTEESFVLNDRP